MLMLVMLQSSAFQVFVILFYSSFWFLGELILICRSVPKTFSVRQLQKKLIQLEVDLVNHS